MDLVISVDSAIAHISATMGIKTWILLPSIPDYRWTSIGHKTKWYKNVFLFRQKKLLEWDFVVEKIKKELKKLIKFYNY